MSNAPGRNDNYSVAARVGQQTLIAVLGSVSITSLVMWLLVGFGPDRSLQAGELWRIALILSTLSPALLCPLLAFPVAWLLRDLRKAQGALAAAALKDPLTGLLNRRGFDLAAAQELGSGAGGAAALMCDIDFFKSINDQYGHECGDDVLRCVGERLRQILAPRRAVLARQGGEEFVVLLPNAGIDEAAAVAESIRAACAAERLDIDGAQANFTVSIGVAAEARSGVQVRPLIGRADAALYQAKRDGRNRVAIADAVAPEGLAA